MTFAQSAGRMTDSIFARGAEDAVWRAGGEGGGVACKVILLEADAAERFGEARAILPTVRLKVRKSEVDAPAEGDTVAIAGGATYRIAAEPMLDRYRLAWLCEAAKV